MLHLHTCDGFGWVKFQSNFTHSVVLAVEKHKSESIRVAKDFVLAN